MKIKVGLDFGFGDIKYAIDIEGKEYVGKFPTVAKEKSSSGTLMNGFVSSPEYIISVDDTPYYIGEKAILEDGEREWNKAIYKHSKFRVLIDSAIAIAFTKAGIKPHEVIVESIVLALPLKHYLRLTKENKKEVRDLFQEATNVKKEELDFKLMYKEQKVNFTGQGYISAVYLDTLSRVRTGKSLVGTLYFGDIGYKTYDEFLIVSNGERINVKETSISTTSDIGIRAFYEAIAEEMADKLSLDTIPLDKIKQSINTKSYSHRGVEKDELFNIVCEKTVETFIDWYKTAIQKAVGEKDLNQLTGIYILGGGGAIFGNEVLKRLDFPVKIQEEDLSLLNAKGCLLQAQKM